MFLNDGSEEWLLIHVEVQGQREADFPRRMFVYAYRLYDRYAREIASLAMPYVSFVERRGEARGEARGRVSGAAWLLRGQIEDRFGALPEPFIARLDQADPERLTV